LKRQEYTKKRTLTRGEKSGCFGGGKGKTPPERRPPEAPPVGGGNARGATKTRGKKGFGNP